MKKNTEPDNSHEKNDVVEEHVREMMEPEPRVRNTAPDPAPPKYAGDTAPELPGADTVKEPEMPAVKTADSLQAAIAEANEALAKKSAEPAEFAPEPQSEDGIDTDNISEPEIADETPLAAVIENPETDKAVDDIVAKESDELLAAEDEKLSIEEVEPDRTSGHGGKGFLARFWGHKAVRRLALFMMLGLLIAAAVVPESRYRVLNTVGVRSSASMTILDQSTQQPLKNVSIRVGESTGQTDKEGQVTLTGVRLGEAELLVERRAFAPISKKITVGWGSNPLGDFQLSPVGSQYAFKVSDFVSGKPVAKAEALYEDASAVSDEEGLIKLTLDKDQITDNFEVLITGEGYRTEKVMVNADNKDEKTIQLVSARKHVFISKRSGKYDVYKIDIDGRNEELVLAGTGNEREDMVLVSHPTEEVAAFVSTRENKRNKDGFLLSSLYILDLENNEVSPLAQSEKTQIVGWVKDRLVYVQIAAGSSAEDPRRHRLVSYSLDSGDSKELATANYFNDVTVIGNKVYYAPSSAYSGAITANFFSIDADGQNKQVILDKEAWSLLRDSYDRLIIALQQEWYEYRPGSNAQPTKLSGEPASKNARIYVDGPDKKQSLWVDQRDGKGVLLAYDTEAKEDKVLFSQSGVKNPLRWLDDHTLVFRIKNDRQTADYVLSTEGGEPKKLRDVTDTNGIDRWYYY